MEAFTNSKRSAQSRALWRHAFRWRCAALQCSEFATILPSVCPLQYRSDDGLCSILSFAVYLRSKNDRHSSLHSFPLLTPRPSPILHHSMDHRKRSRTDNDGSPVVYQQHFKRGRTCTIYSNTTNDPVLSSSSTADDNDNNDSRTPSPSSVVTIETPWWKQQRISPPPMQQQQRQQCCFICEKPMQTDSSDTTIHHHQQPQSNTLLAYFQCSSTLQQQQHNNRTTTTTTTTNTAPQQQQKSSCCNYCCRDSICPDCMAPCDACGHMYCSFCRTQDYTIVQSLCPDCCCCCSTTEARDDCSSGGGGGAPVVEEDAMDIG